MKRKDMAKKTKRLRKAVKRKLDGGDDGKRKVLAAAGLATAGVVGVGVARALSRKGNGVTRYHVVPDEERWAVRREGEDDPLATFAHKRSALSAARSAAKDTEPSVLTVHGKDGKILRSHVYGTERSPDGD